MNTLKILLIIAALVAPSSTGFAATCSALSPARHSQTLFNPLEGNILSEETHEKLAKFFDRLNKDRDGYAQGYFCDEGKRKVTSNNSKVRFRPQLRDNNGIQYYLYFEGDEQGFDKEKVIYDLTDTALFLGPKEGKNEVVIRDIGKSILVTYEKVFQRTPSGGRVVKEIIRHYQLDDSLTIDSTYYMNGFLISENRCILH